MQTSLLIFIYNTQEKILISAPQPVHLLVCEHLDQAIGLGYRACAAVYHHDKLADVGVR